MTESKVEIEPREILMRHRTVLLKGDITSESVTDVATRLLILQSQSSDRIDLLIDSGGGENRAAFRLCDTIECLMTADVRGIAIGSCSSAATFVMLHCRQRVATPNARFVVHSGAIGGISIPVNHGTQTELECLLEETRRSHETMIRMYMRKMHISRKAILALIHHGDQRFNNAISAQEAVKVGLIQRIETRLKIFPELIKKAD